MKYYLIAFLFLLLIACDCNQTVGGFVYDKQTNNPIIGAIVYKKERADYKVTTDSLGYFIISHISGGLSCPPMNIAVEHDGYKMQELSISSGSEKIIYLEK